MKSTVTRSSVFLSTCMLVGWASSSLGGPIPPGPTGNFVNNSSAAQNAVFNVSSGTVRGKLTAGELAVSTLTIAGPVSGTFSGNGAGLTGLLWSHVVKTGSNLSDLITRDHSVLTSTGTNSHAVIDGHIAATMAVHGATSATQANRIVQRDASGDFAARVITASTFTGTLNGNAATATTATNIAGGSLGTIPYQTASGTTAMLPVGPFNYVLQGKGALTPTWTSSPTITGQNITAIPLSALSAGTLPVSIPASSITVTGVAPGTYGGPVQAAQIVVGSDGRITSAAQYSIPNLDPTVLPHLAALDVATATLTIDLATEVSDRANSDLAIGVATETLRTDLSAEVIRATARENAIGVSTGTNYAAINSTAAALTAETAARISADSALAVSTGSLQSSLSAVILSTGALESSKANRAGDTFTGPILGTSITASSVTTTALTFSGPCTVGYRLTAIDNAGTMGCQPPASSVSADYFFSRDVFPVTGYAVMYTSAQVTAAISTRTFATIGATPIIVSTFASLSGYPGITVQPGGAYTIDFRAAKTSGNANQSLYMYATIYRYTSGGAEIPIFTAPTTLISNTVPAQYLVTGTTIAFAMASTDRFLLRTYAYSSGSGSPLPTLALYGGNGYSTKLTVPQAAANVGTYVPWTGGQFDLNLNTHKITASSAVLTGPLTASSLTVTGNGQVNGSAFSVGGSTLVVANGLVGIGITDPMKTLDILGSARVQGTSTSFAEFTLKDTTAGGSSWNMYSGYPALGDFTIRESGVSNWLVIKKTSGNVGIGTTAPSGKLEVAGTVQVSSATLRVSGTGAGITTTGDVTAVAFHGNGSALTGLPGGGDAVLAATQTFTGANTFTSSVTLPTRDKIVFGNELANSSSTVIPSGYYTAQTTFADCVTGSTLTITTNGGRVVVGFAGGIFKGALSTTWVAYKIDGVVPSPWTTTGAAVAAINTNWHQNLSFTDITGSLSPGSHSFCLVIRNDSQTSYVDQAVKFWIYELR